MDLRAGLILIIVLGARGAENRFHFDLPVLCGQVPLPVMRGFNVTVACTNMDDWARHTTTFWKKVILFSFFFFEGGGQIKFVGAEPRVRPTLYVILLPALRRNCCPLRLQLTI